MINIVVFFAKKKKARFLDPLRGGNLADRFSGPGVNDHADQRMILIDSASPLRSG